MNIQISFDYYSFNACNPLRFIPMKWVLAIWCHWLTELRAAFNQNMKCQFFQVCYMKSDDSKKWPILRRADPKRLLNSYEFYFTFFAVFLWFSIRIFEWTHFELTWILNRIVQRFTKKKFKFNKNQRSFCPSTFNINTHTHHTHQLIPI